jgi:hypothetical protein
MDESRNHHVKKISQLKKTNIACFAHMQNLHIIMIIIKIIVNNKI